MWITLKYRYHTFNTYTILHIYLPYHKVKTIPSQCYYLLVVVIFILQHYLYFHSL